MFHFPASPPAPYELQTRVTPHNGRRVPPFGNPRITARKPAPRGISQATTSFIGPQCQGIHRTLITTNTHKQTIKQTQSRHMRHTTARHHPHTPPPNQERRKQERRGRTGQPAADREPQNINIKNPSNPTTRVRRSFTYYRCSRPLCSSQPTRPHPPHNFLEEGGVRPRAHRPRTRQRATPRTHGNTIKGNPLERR